MKFKILQLIVATALAITANSQQQTFKGTDGTTVTANIISTNPDEGKHASIYVGVFGPEGVNVVGASYYKPGALYLNAMAGPTGGMIDGSFFFLSGMKECKLRQSIKSGAIANSYITAPLDKRKSLGVHAGTNYIDYSSFKTTYLNPFSASGVFGGLTFLSSGHAHWKIDKNNQEVQGTTIGRVNADIIYYTNRKLVNIKDSKEHVLIDEVSRKIGFRVYFDGKTSVWSRNGRTSINYMIGVGRNADRATNFVPFGGIGFGYNFL